MKIREVAAVALSEVTGLCSQFVVLQRNQTAGSQSAQRLIG